MKSIKNISVSLIVASVLVACGSTPQKAPIEDRSQQTSRSNVKVEDSQTQYVVKKGDTLYRVALEKGQSYSDLVIWNNLVNPNDIKVGQVLQIVPPDTGTSSVISPTAIEVRPLGSNSDNAGATPSLSNNKNGPRADKRPYSDVALAELQKNETTDVSPVKVITKSAEKAFEPAVVDEIAWVWPAEGKVITNFDDNKSKGIDVAGKLGQNIYAAADGTVMYAGRGIRGYGNLVIIKHSNNFLSAYAHNQVALVKEKQVISKGQKIAEMGNSDSDTVKLHFEIRQHGKPVDPMRFLPDR